MKPIVIRHFHRIPLIVSIPIVLLTPLLLAMILFGNESLSLIGILLLAIIATGLGFFSSYGIKITEKKVVLISQDFFKIFRYEDVISITVIFYPTRIRGEVRVKGQKPYSFIFDGVDLSRPSALIRAPLITSLKLSQTFVDKSISKLLTCEKVKIQNNYTKG